MNSTYKRSYLKLRDGMAGKKKKKDLWDKLSVVTPLLIGILVTGVGAAFTNVYNFRQLQLNQIQALDKLRPQLTSKNPLDRAFAYKAFVTLDYEDLAIELIELQQDLEGLSVLKQLKNSTSTLTRQKASTVYDSLSRIQKQSDSIIVEKNVIPKSALQRKFTLEDSLKAMSIATGKRKMEPEDSYLDVAPIINGKSAPDGIIDVGDSLVILDLINRQNIKSRDDKLSNSNPKTIDP